MFVSLTQVYAGAEHPHFARDPEIFNKLSLFVSNQRWLQMTDYTDDDCKTYVTSNPIFPQK